MNILENYYKWFGQSVNSNKSGVYFSEHTLPHIQRSIKDILHIKKNSRRMLSTLVHQYFYPKPPLKTFLSSKISLKPKCQVGGANVSLR